MIKEGASVFFELFDLEEEDDRAGDSPATCLLILLVVIPPVWLTTEW